MTLAGIEADRRPLNTGHLHRIEQHDRLLGDLLDTTPMVVRAPDAEQHRAASILSKMLMQLRPEQRQTAGMARGAIAQCKAMTEAVTYRWPEDVLLDFPRGHPMHEHRWQMSTDPADDRCEQVVAVDLLVAHHRETVQQAIHTTEVVKTTLFENGKTALKCRFYIGTMITEPDHGMQ